MADRSAELSAPCDCGNVILIEQNWTAGGVNDYGGFIVACGACHRPIDIYIGRDVMDSRLIGGGRKLADYDKDIPGDRDDARARFGLPPLPKSA